MLGPSGTSHDDVRDQSRRKEAVLDDARVRREPHREVARVVEHRRVVADDAAVRARRDVPERHRAESSHRRCEAVHEELERNRRAEPVDELVGGDDHDEAIGGRGDDLLSRVCCPASFHEPPSRIDLVGAVDRDVKADRSIRAGERLDTQSQLARCRFRRGRGGDAAQVETARRQCPEKVADGRARPQPDGHAVLDELRRSLGCALLLAIEPHPGGRYPETTVEHSPERELKLAADTDFRLPSIYGLGGATVRSAPPERNDTTYYDTDDLRLARWGASLRHRPGEGWTVKLPAERDAPFLVRPEIVFAGNGGRPPAAAVELVRGFVRNEELAVQVRMTTIRRRTGLHDSGGQLIGGVVDDAVSVLGDDHTASSFRELEVEIGDEMTPGLLDALVERLRQAGAGAPDQTAKYIRALADRPLTPEVPVSDLAADATAGDVIRRAIALSVIRLILHDPVVRVDVDPEGVHQARVATRRLRSDLRTFRSLVEPKFASEVRDELGWLAAILGEVRDGDVLLDRFRGRVAELSDEDRAGVAGVLETLGRARNLAHARLLETLGSTRYVELLDRLVDAANAPALLDAAAAPAGEAIPALVRRPWHALAKRVGALGERPSDEQLHEIRIRTKRVRYAADAAAAVVGKPARSFARAAAGLQEVLGDLNDAVVAASWLDVWLAETREPAETRAARALADAERSGAAHLRAGWHTAWEKLAAPELRAWM